MILLTVVKKIFHFLPIIPFNFPFAQCTCSFPDLHISFNFYKSFSTSPFLTSFFLSLFFLLNFPPSFHPVVHRCASIRNFSILSSLRYFINCLFSFRCPRTFVLSHLPIFFFSSSSILSAIFRSFLSIFSPLLSHMWHRSVPFLFLLFFPSPFFSFSFFFFANASPSLFCVIVYTSLLLYFPSSVPFLREIYNVPSQSNFSSSQRRNNLDANSRPGTPSSESHLRESDPWRELRSRKSNDDVRLRALLCCSIRKPVLPSPNLPLILTFADFHSN